MKKTFLILLVMFMTMSSFAITVLKPDAKGVWANATSELVQTDSVLIYFTQNDSLQTKSATLVIPTRQIHTTTVFTSDTILINEAEPLDIVVGAILSVHTHNLKLTFRILLLVCNNGNWGLR